MCEKAGRLPAELGELRGCTGHAVLSDPLPVEAVCSLKKLPYRKKKNPTIRHISLFPLSSLPPLKKSPKPKKQHWRYIRYIGDTSALQFSMWMLPSCVQLWAGTWLLLKRRQSEFRSIS